ncbi:unnamed protein product [Hydatigera taeniaeformis]|uniref:Uncharacterized protein n=1 Tax=Hydatigena taeniaeformis TaxID=6205 RepID=A0A0R3WXZ8_HYDTA|nr:unnamed protein product [Hydatigera taeniaeformis]
MWPKSEVKTRNVTATAYILGTLEKEEFGSGCLLPQPEYSDYYELRVVENALSLSENNATVCTIVTWTVDDASARSLLGYVLEITQSTANTCRLIWIPCVDCFPHHSLRNALPAVEEQLREIETQCTKVSTQLLQHAERLDSKLYRTTIRLVLGFQSSGETNDTFSGMVRVHAVKMGSVHQIMEHYWPSTAKGKATS